MSGFVMLLLYILLVCVEVVRSSFGWGAALREKAPMRCNLRKGGTAHGGFFFFGEAIKSD